MRATVIATAAVLLTAACISTRPAAPRPAPTPVAIAQTPSQPQGPAAETGDTAWLPENLRLAAESIADPLEAARLAENEMVTLPTRANPIERWKARRYFCLADFNRDDAITEEDTRTFLEAYTTREGPFAEFLDLNGDGIVDASDLDLMLHAAETACDPELTAQNRDISC